MYKPEAALQIANQVQNRLKRSVIGRDEVIELVVIALLSDGHVLLEDYQVLEEQPWPRRWATPLWMTSQMID